RRDILIFLRKQPRSKLEQGHLAAEIFEDRRQLAASGRSTDDRDAGRQLLEGPDIVVGQAELGSRNRQQAPLSTHSDDDLVCLPCSSVCNLHRMLIEEVCWSNSFDKLNTPAAYIFGHVLFLVGVARDPPSIGQDGGQIDGRAFPLQAEGLPG